MAGDTSGGRAASIARRQALSAGKAALPPPKERVRTGEREAAIVSAAAPAPVMAAPAPAPVVATPAPPSMAAPVASSAPAPAVISSGGLSGRAASMVRRALLIAGKTALKAGTAVGGQGSVATPVESAPAAASMAVAASVSTAREFARARRAMMAQAGRGSAPPARPGRPVKQGSIDYAPKVVVSETQAHQSVTGLRIGQGRTMTGDERGVSKPVSGTQYLPVEDGASFRAGGPKVGLARTEAGQVVTGTLVRSAVRITGDEAGQKVSITGEADQRPGDDLTKRSDAGGFTAAQFARQANPHGATVFGTNLGRSMKTAGSRERNRSIALETTDRGMAITGSAVGRSVRVTGDENGACRSITGTQYLAPAARNAACSGAGAAGGDRTDPVTVNKVTVSQSWGGQRVTGPDIEHNPRVTGDEPGSCSVVTGSQYQGPMTAEGWCEADAGQRMAGRLVRKPADAPVTGDTPVHVGAVTGTARGAGRDITGTPYYRSDAEVIAPGDPVAAMDARFSIRTPQRSAHLVAAQGRASAPPPAERITGSFATGVGKITGNVEFQAKPRTAANSDRKPAHASVTGEGAVGAVKRITGDSWENNALVTGQEAAFSAERNPSERGPKGKAFAGTGTFKQLAVHEEPKQLVTGMMGYFNKSGARVTLSGGANS